MTSPTTADFRAGLLDAGLLYDSGVDGLFHRSGTFEAIVRGVERAASAAGSDQNAQTRFFPPVFPRTAFEKTDYLRSFPDLIGSIDTFVGTDRDHAELLRIASTDGDWTEALTPAEVVLSPAACHSLYPTLPDSMPDGGRVFEVSGYVFRHEPSLDPARMQSFRMHEFVFLGAPEEAVAHRDRWLERGMELLGGLGLDVATEVANDPFFGRVGQMLANNQRDATLKYEIVAPITDIGLTAISSANCHLDHFGLPFGISSADGEPAHSACFGFGLERITLALLSGHGLDVAGWPAPVRQRLAL